MNAVEVEKLSRSFGARLAVDSVSFAIEPGEVFGLLGPNGAGKTTMIKMLTCQLQATAGTARLFGNDIRSEEAQIKPLIGVVFEEQNLYERMSGRENLEFFAALYGAEQRRIDDVLALVGLTQRAKDRVVNYSNGMRQRLLIARAILHEPKILFLDEPTHALDPATAREVRRLIADLKGKGVTVFLTTHDMEEADRLCHRVAIIDNGHIVALDTPQALKLAYGQHTAKVLRRDGQEQTFSMGIPLEAERLASLIAADEVLTIHSQEATLEDAFIALTGRKLVE